jgi:MSHA biogenesis protein MshP
VSAVFLLTVLAGLGVVAVRLGTVGNQTVTQSLRAAQAFQAARAGAAWGAHRAVSGSCGSATLTLTEGGTAGFDVTVSCVSTSHMEGTLPVNVYVIDVLAEAGVYGGPDYVSRRVQIKLTDAA